VGTLARWLLSFFGCGLFPKIPGTVGTAGAAAVAAAILVLWPEAAANWLPLCVAWIVASSVVTVALTPLVEAQCGKDPQLIVTDEVAGYWATLCLCTRPDLTTLVVAFFLFRFLDVVKPWPACALERLPGGWGVLLDDVMSGLYGAVALWGLDRLIVLA
jgi:phosphatidylglycerophosphatase A